MRPYIDVHAHTYFNDYDVDRAEVLGRAKEAGVDIINVGTGAVSSKLVVELAKQADLKAVVGLHPVYVGQEVIDDPDLVGEPPKVADRFKIIEELAVLPEVVAIGECGLDYFHLDSEAIKTIQKDWFVNQIELSKKVAKPLMLHVRNGKNKADTNSQAYADVLELLKNSQATKGDVHFFAGTVEEAKAFLDLGFYLSFTGVVTFAADYEELVKYVPLDRILTETDCPYVAPVPHRGKRNEPVFVIEVANKIAGIKGLDREMTAQTLRENAYNLFNF